MVTYKTETFQKRLSKSPLPQLFAGKYHILLFFFFQNIFKRHKNMSGFPFQHSKNRYIAQEIWLKQGQAIWVCLL